MDDLFASAEPPWPRRRPAPADEPDADALDAAATRLAAAHRPVLVLGSDVWADGAEQAALPTWPTTWGFR